MNTLSFYDNRYIKTKTRTCGDKDYTNFRHLIVPEEGAEYESFTILSIDSLLVSENKYYLQVCLDNRAYKTVNTEMVDHFDGNLFETD